MSFIFWLALCPCIFLVYYTSPLFLLSTFHIPLLRGMQYSSNFHLCYTSSLFGLIFHHTLHYAVLVTTWSELDSNSVRAGFFSRNLLKGLSW